MSRKRRERKATAAKQTVRSQTVSELPHRSRGDHLTKLGMSAGIGVVIGSPAAFAVFALADQAISFWPVFQAGAIAGALVGSMTYAWRRWRMKVGGVTAVVAVSIVAAALAVVFAQVSPSCPGVIGATSRCTTSETGTWALVGLLTPVTAALVVGPILITLRFGSKIVRWVRAGEWRLILGRSTTGGRATTGVGGSKTSALGTPTGKGRATPKRPRKKSPRTSVR